MEIIKRPIEHWKPRENKESDYGKYQYLYRNNGKTISLVYLECAGHKFMWEMYGYRNAPEHNRRFNTQEEAEEVIIDILVGDDIEDLVAWKVAKNNIIIQE